MLNTTNEYKISTIFHQDSCTYKYSYFRRRRATLIHVGVLLASRWRSLAPPVEK